MREKRIYLDAAPVIYLIEGVSPFAARVEAYLTKTTSNGSRANDAGELTIVASDLTRLECRIKPMHEDDAALLGEFDDFFDGVDQIVLLSRAVVDTATKIRDAWGFKTPDALHLAAAVTSDCDVFYTNDHRLDRFDGLTMQVV